MAYVAQAAAWIEWISREEDLSLSTDVHISICIDLGVERHNKVYSDSLEH